MSQTLNTPKHEVDCDVCRWYWLGGKNDERPPCNCEAALQQATGDYE